MLVPYSGNFHQLITVDSQKNIAYAVGLTGIEKINLANGESTLVSAERDEAFIKFVTDAVSGY